MKLFDKFLIICVISSVSLCAYTWYNYTERFKIAQKEHPVERQVVAQPTPILVVPSWEPTAPSTTPIIVSKPIVVLAPKPTKIPMTTCYHFLDNVEHCSTQ